MVFNFFNLTICFTTHNERTPAESSESQRKVEMRKILKIPKKEDATSELPYWRLLSNRRHPAARIESCSYRFARRLSPADLTLFTAHGGVKTEP